MAVSGLFKFKRGRSKTGSTTNLSQDVTFSLKNVFRRSRHSSVTPASITPASVTAASEATASVTPASVTPPSVTPTQRPISPETLTDEVAADLSDNVLGTSPQNGDVSEVDINESAPIVCDAIKIRSLSYKVNNLQSTQSLRRLRADFLYAFDTKSKIMEFLEALGNELTDDSFLSSVKEHARSSKVSVEWVVDCFLGRVSSSFQQDVTLDNFVSALDFCEQISLFSDQELDPELEVFSVFISDTKHRPEWDLIAMCRLAYEIKSMSSLSKLSDFKSEMLTVFDTKSKWMAFFEFIEEPKISERLKSFLSLPGISLDDVFDYFVANVNQVINGSGLYQDDIFRVFQACEQIALFGEKVMTFDLCGDVSEDQGRPSLDVVALHSLVFDLQSLNSESSDGRLLKTSVIDRRALFLKIFNSKSKMLILFESIADKNLLDSLKSFILFSHVTLEESIDFFFEKVFGRICENSLSFSFIPEILESCATKALSHHLNKISEGSQDLALLSEPKSDRPLLNPFTLTRLVTKLKSTPTGSLHSIRNDLSQVLDTKEKLKLFFDLLEDVDLSNRLVAYISFPAVKLEEVMDYFFENVTTRALSDFEGMLSKIVNAMSLLEKVVLLGNSVLLSHREAKKKNIFVKDTFCPASAELPKTDNMGLYFSRQLDLISDGKTCNDAHNRLIKNNMEISSFLKLNVGESVSIMDLIERFGILYGKDLEGKLSFDFVSIPLRCTDVYGNEFIYDLEEVRTFVGGGDPHLVLIPHNNCAMSSISVAVDLLKKSNEVLQILRELPIEWDTFI